MATPRPVALAQEQARPAGESEVPAGHASALPAISVVVPSYNQVAFLAEALDSLFVQDYPALEVLVLDGGSTDGSAEVIRRYEDRLAFWRSGRDGGQSRAINDGMARATGEIVAWLNSDDLQQPDALWIVADAVRRHPFAVLYVGNGLRLDQANGRRFPFCPRHVAFRRDALLEGPDYVLQPSSFYRRAAWNQVGGLRPHLDFCMDWDLFLRLSEIGPVVTIDQYLGVSREYQDTKTSSGGIRRGAEIAKMTTERSGRPLTLGGVHYLLEEIRKTFGGDEEPEILSALHQAAYRVHDAFGRRFGHADGFPIENDANTSTYVPIAELGALARTAAEEAARVVTSIVVSSRGSIADLGVTLEGLFGEDVPGLEIVIADAGTTDGRLELAASFGGTPKAVTVPVEASPEEAFALALAETRGEVVAWLEPGERPSLGALAATVRAFAADDRVDVVYGSALFVDPDGRRRAVARSGGMANGHWRGDLQEAASDVPRCTVFCRRRVLSGPLPRLDSTFAAALVARGAHAVRLDRTQALVTWHEGALENGIAVDPPIATAESPLLRLVSTVRRRIAR